MEKTTKAIEDYLEAILILEKNNLPVQSIDVAKFLNVSRAAVSKIMIDLSNNEYIEKEFYGKISLTEKGRELANKIYKKHKLIKEFLMSIGVKEDVAEIDCCKIEHIVSEETLNKMEEQLKNITK